MSHRGFDPWPLVGVSLGTLLFFGTAPAVEIAQGYVTNVSSRSFTAVWTQSDAATPALHVYTDSEGTQEVTDQLEVELYAVRGPKDAIPGDMDVAAQAKVLQASMAIRNLVVARVSRAEPGTDYWYRFAANDGVSPTAYPAAGPAQVTLPPEIAFVASPVQLTLAMGEELPGSVVIIEVPGTQHAVAGVLGDGANPDEVVLNLADVRNEDGTPWTLDAVTTINLTWWRDATTSEAFSGNLHPAMPGFVVNVEALAWEDLPPDTDPPDTDTDVDTDTDTDADTDLVDTDSGVIDTDTGMDTDSGITDTDTGETGETGDTDLVDTDTTDTDPDPPDTDPPDTDPPDTDPPDEPFSLEIQGNCPGGVFVGVRNATPSGTVIFLTAEGEGEMAVPTGPCRGVRSNLDQTVQLRAAVNARADGSVVLAPRIMAPAACDYKVQAFDVGSCTFSELAEFPPP